MSAVAQPARFQAARFRARLLAGIMLVVAVMAGVVLYFAERELAASAEHDFDREFQSAIFSWRSVQEFREASLAERVRVLARKPKLQEGLEDYGRDRLYPEAGEYMRDIMELPSDPGPPSEQGLHAEFYRFLDRKGRVIPTEDTLNHGYLTPEEEKQLELPSVPREQQIGYLVRQTPGGEERLTEIVARPIISGDHGEVIGTLLIGFETLPLQTRAGAGILRGLWREGRLYAPAVDAATRDALAAEVRRAIALDPAGERSFRSEVGGVPHLLFFKRLNPGSIYAAAYEVSVYPLTELVEGRSLLRLQVAGAGLVLLLGAFGASHFISGRLAGPVVQLADSSEQDREQRHKAEVALELSHEELQRAARFSADASHQLKTPVTVLRAGLEEMLHRESITPRESEEIAALIHQTYRLTGIVDDLLLLSRIDAGRLMLELVPVSLNELVEAGLDDVGAASGASGVTILSTSRVPAGLRVLGDRRYLSLVIQNLLENAWKYNRPGGRIEVTTRIEDEWLDLTVANTGTPIPAAARERIFERFHRGAVGENVPGYGLGLNLARELARLHGGSLRLARSDESLTEFVLRLRRAST